MLLRHTHYNISDLCNLNFIIPAQSDANVTLPTCIFIFQGMLNQDGEFISALKRGVFSHNFSIFNIFCDLLGPVVSASSLVSYNQRQMDVHCSRFF